VNKRAYTTVSTGTESVAEALLQSALPCGSVTVDLRACTIVGSESVAGVKVSCLVGV
jgi:hypothetical protein